LIGFESLYEGETLKSNHVHLLTIRVVKGHEAVEPVLLLGIFERYQKARAIACTAK
jgi:hypothetical protein